MPQTEVFEITKESKSDYPNGTVYSVVDSGLPNFILDQFFEGYHVELEGGKSKYITPLTEAKNFARKHGFKTLKVVSMSMRIEDKIYQL